MALATIRPSCSRRCRGGLALTESRLPHLLQPAERSTGSAGLVRGWGTLWRTRYGVPPPMWSKKCCTHGSMSNQTLCCRSPVGLFVALLLVTAACNRDVAGPRRVNVASAAWPHEPAGFTVLIDEPFNALNENGWQAVQSQTTNGSGLSLAADAGAPQSPSSVL